MATGVSTMAQIRVWSGAPPLTSPSTMACTSSAEFDLRHDHPGGPRRGRRGDVVGVPRRVEAVDPDGDLLAAVLAGAHRGAHAVAGVGLGVGGDGVLEVEDERVGGQRLGLLERPLVGAGHVEHRAAGEDGVGRSCQAFPAKP